jgi:hypothetical protein
VHSFNSTGIEPVNEHYSKEWKDWARKLHKLGLSNLVSALLENGGAFAALIAQSLYVAQPVLESIVPVQSLTRMLDDPNQTKAFAELLREENE